MRFPKVSVFLPTYNQENYITEAIESVLTQDYPNLEIVIGDDGSTDKTPEIIKSYKERFPELFKLIISEKNEGITANCNKILKECTGEYAALFSGDDVWLPRKLHSQVEYLKKNQDVSLCFTKVEVFDSESGEIMFISPNDDLLEKNGNIIDLSGALASAGCSILIPRWAIPKHGFEKSAPYVSDWLFWADALSKGKAGFIPEIFARYRRHPRNTSNKSNLINSEQLMALTIFEEKYPELCYTIEKKRAMIIRKIIYHNYSQNKNSTSNENIVSILKSMKFTQLLRAIVSLSLQKLTKQID